MSVDNHYLPHRQETPPHAPRDGLLRGGVRLVVVDGVVESGADAAQDGLLARCEGPETVALGEQLLETREENGGGQGSSGGRVNAPNVSRQLSSDNRTHMQQHGDSRREMKRAHPPPKEN